MKKPLLEESSTVMRINVTPIIDVALVLVIILLITAPMIAVSDVDVELPKAQTRSIESDARVNVTLGLGGELAVDDRDIARAELPGLIAERIATDGERLMVVVRADEGVPYTAVEDVLKLTRSAGASRLAIATQQRGKATGK